MEVCIWSNVYIVKKVSIFFSIKGFLKGGAQCCQGGGKLCPPPYTYALVRPFTVLKKNNKALFDMFVPHISFLLDKDRYFYLYFA